MTTGRINQVTFPFFVAEKKRGGEQASEVQKRKMDNERKKEDFSSLFSRCPQAFPCLSLLFSDYYNPRKEGRVPFQEGAPEEEKKRRHLFLSLSLFSSFLRPFSLFSFRIKVCFEPGFFFAKFPRFPLFSDRKRRAKIREKEREGKKKKFFFFFLFLRRLGPHKRCELG